MFYYLLLKLKSKLPFAIVGSNTTIEIDGKSFRGRQYPWGCVNGK
jgi:septin family protein